DEGAPRPGARGGRWGEARARVCGKALLGNRVGEIEAVRRLRAAALDDERDEPTRNLPPQRQWALARDSDDSGVGAQEEEEGKPARAAERQDGDDRPGADDSLEGSGSIPVSEPPAESRARGVGRARVRCSL